LGREPHLLTGLLDGHQGQNLTTLAFTIHMAFHESTYCCSLFNLPLYGVSSGAYRGLMMPGANTWLCVPLSIAF